MEHLHILDQIPFQINFPQLLKKLRLDEDNGIVDDLRAFVAQAEALARPKAMYRVAFIDRKDEAQVVIEGVTLSSRVLRVNLDQAQRVFAYVATCGMELQEFVDSREDFLERYWGETLKEQALFTAIKALNEHIEDRYRPGHTSGMAPGSLADWPLKEQRPLFAILNDPEQWIGVHLTPSLLMIPTKSVSGVRFPTEESFESCQLCPRAVCPNRRAPYDADLYDKKYRHATA